MAKYFTLGHLKIIKWNYSSTVLAAKVWVLYDKNVQSGYHDFQAGPNFYFYCK